MDSEQLKKLQSVLLMMIKDIDLFCKENGIEYFLGGGTLLGAVRHGGFIPWDDDVDLMMTRDNYDKFVKVAPKLDKKYFVQEWSLDKNWNYAYTKIRLNGTRFSTEFSEQFKNLHQGIFIDIFVEDKTAKSRLLQKLQIFKIRLWHSVIRYRWRRLDSSDKKINAPILTKIAALFCSMKKAKRNLDKSMRRYNKKETGLLIDSSGMHLKSGGFTKSWLDSSVNKQFEDTVLPVPVEYDAYLKSLYGDYMKPNKFDSHDSGAEVDFGEY